MCNNKKIVFFDAEISEDKKQILDLGAIRSDGAKFHSSNTRAFAEFVKGAEYVCGHNIVHFDLRFTKGLFDWKENLVFIDTLYLSPLLFPKRNYHRLIKDYILQSDELNNPLCDAINSKTVFHDEIEAFMQLSPKLKRIFCSLLYDKPEFQGFFKYNNFIPYALSGHIIKGEFQGKICENADLDSLIRNNPIELAYALALINVDDRESITPQWVLKNFPEIENVMRMLRGVQCEQGCEYCNKKHDVRVQLKRYFGFNEFRTYNGEALQERAAEAAVKGNSLLAVFPTGGGKSITFQLPALMAGDSVHGLTVVISPLQSLMKDQVDNLEEKGITEAVTINGLLSPIERGNALERVMNGTASLLYISPEQLRSRTIEKLLMSRTVVRFVIDEAHCFSAWGQDFRVDYLYIGDFIKELSRQKKLKNPIPVSCFTATAKQKVITDICDYFKRTLDLDLELYATNATRKNLHYSVIYKESDEEKYNTLRTLIEAKNCPTIVYVSRTKRARILAEKLNNDGFLAKPFYGDMDTADKIAYQNQFVSNQIQVMVATSAFGMGVDKKDVKLVIHYDISDSLENYVQESGRAGRDQSLQAECFVLFNDRDLDKHFILLNQTKLSISEIQQVWKAIKDLTKVTSFVCCSALEIARQAGWDDSKKEIETRVRTALSALESAGYIKRGRNVPRIYATSIRVRNMQEAVYMLEKANIFDEQQMITAKRIIKLLISKRSTSINEDEAESRIDYIADSLGLPKEHVIESINMMKSIKLLEDASDMTAYIYYSDTENKSMQTLERMLKLEEYMMSRLSDDKCSSFNLKELNEQAHNVGIKQASIKDIKTITYFWTIKGYIKKSEYYSQNRTDYEPMLSLERLTEKRLQRAQICRFIIQELYSKNKDTFKANNEQCLVDFSLVGLTDLYNKRPDVDMFFKTATLTEVEDALLYLSKIGAMRLQGGFLVSYNGMEIRKVIKDNKIRYKNDDYKLLSEFYKQKIQQIHIVGEYANLMVKDYDAALAFVNDYFRMDFRKFIAKYFKGERAAEIERNATPEKYKKIYGCLSEVQSKIIVDDSSKYIVVAAGPGSGKTRVLVHKLASLLMLEDVKHEQLLMVTFSRAAATEFKKRLMELIDNAAHYVEIKTFHSYCFDLIGKIGSLEASQNVVKDAAEMIRNGEVEMGKITKSVVVIDEAQDMDEDEFALIQALMARNEDMRLIAVGDDDQNIYEFRGSDSKFMKSLISEYGAQKYEMVENYRSRKEIVEFSNTFVKKLRRRMKEEDGITAVEGQGHVKLVHHNCKHMEEAVVEDVINNNNSGTVCILTGTNEETLQLMGLLTKKGCRAKLIQSMDGFNLYNLMEVRYFVDQIDSMIKTPVISDNIWQIAKRKLIERFKGSDCLDNCINMIEDFEVINKNRTKYRTDLEEFIKESNYEDFYRQDKDVIIVSTIHKAKGREFDNVYMMLDGVSLNTEENIRKVYVGITRAKNQLVVHYNNDSFNNIEGDGVIKIKDEKEYGEPQEITLQLTHKDVVLDFFKDKGNLVRQIKSGVNISVENEYLCASINGVYMRVAKLSKAFIERLNALQTNNYHVDSAFVRFIVWWKGKTDDKETAIILPEIHLKK